MHKPDNLSSKKKLLFITGTRADFGKLAPLAASAIKANFEVTFFITGMHMMKRYGETRLEVKKFKGSSFFEFVNQKEGDSQDFILSKTILGLSDFLHEHIPDLVIIHGDRIEAFAASIVCGLNYIPSAHIEGGEVSGTIDEVIRHCNTKLCHTHFVSSYDALKRVHALGEPLNRIFIIGSPELDVHRKPSGVSIDEVKSYYEINFDDYGIVVFHPVTSELETLESQVKTIFTALKKTNRNYVVIAPNNDPGTDKIFKTINTLPNERFRVIPSMRFNYFSELMKNASIMLGNSSAGVREAPFIGIKSIDIGSRQNNRSQANSVITCQVNNLNKLKILINENWGKKVNSDSSFGEGLAADKFLEVISNPNFWNIRMQKEFS